VKTRLVFLCLFTLSAISVGLFLHESNQFVAYEHFKPLLSTSAPAGSLEYVMMSHPAFEGVCYQLNRRVMTVKLSDSHTEKFVLVPDSDWDQMIDWLHSREIPIIAVD
jgi:hypothetical protein